MKALLLALLLFVPTAAAAAGPEAGPCVPCDLLFASTGGSDGRLFTIEPETGVTTDIGPVVSYTDIALTPDGRLYGLGPGGRLHELDPCTAEATPLDLLTTRPGATGTTEFNELLAAGSLLQHVDLVAETTTDLPSGGWCGFAAGDLALNPCDGFAWQVSRGPACPCAADDTLIERLDPATGDVLEQVSCLPFTALFGLAFDSACNLWLVDAATQSLIRFDPLARDWTILPSDPLGGVLGLASVPCSIEGVCVAGGPYEATCGSAPCPDGEALVELDASGSALPSATPLDYDWTIRCPGGVVAAASGELSSLCLSAGCAEVCDVELVVSNLEGREVSCFTTLTLSDSGSPSLVDLPPDLVVECDEVPAPAPVTAGDDCDGALVPAFEEVRIDGDCPAEYLLLRAWSAVDSCGNVVNATQEIQVIDSGPPSLVDLPPDLVVECDEVPAPAPVTAGDDCDGALVPAFEEVRIDGDCPGEYVLLRTWSAIDSCGDFVNATQEIQVIDTTPPLVEEDDAVVACLWPPNHRFVRLDAELFAPLVEDACSGPVDWRLAGCESDEPDDGLGDGHTFDDCRIAEDGAALLVRAERLGNEDGRVYSVTVIAVDACGNESAPTAAGRILVPHDRREHLDCLAATERPDRRAR